MLNSHKQTTFTTKHFALAKCRNTEMQAIACISVSTKTKPLQLVVSLSLLLTAAQICISLSGRDELDDINWIVVRPTHL